MIESNIRVNRLSPEVAPLKQATSGSACVDISYWPTSHKRYTVYTEHNEKLEYEIGFDGELILDPFSRTMVPTGMIFDISPGYHAKIYMRSGTALKKGLMLINGVGIIDQDYFDEVFLLVYNATHIRQRLKPGDRIAQAEFCASSKFNINNGGTDNELQPAPRLGGFGSTGVN